MMCCLTGERERTPGGCRARQDELQQTRAATKSGLGGDRLVGAVGRSGSMGRVGPRVGDGTYWYFPQDT